MTISLSIQAKTILITRSSLFVHINFVNLIQLNKNKEVNLCFD
jgi:hypothetical protein